MKNSISLLLIIGLMVSSCASKRKPSTVTPPIPYIIFLNYSITKTNSAKPKMELVSKIITEGQLKEDFESLENPKKGDFVLLQLDPKGQAHDTIYIANPLIKNIEYVGEEGQLGKKTVNLKSAQLSLRVQLEPPAKEIYIRLFSDQPDSEDNFLIHHNLFTK